MFGVADKLQDVPLRNAHVFQYFPWGMLSALRLFTSQASRQILDRGFKSQVSATIVEQIEQMFSQRLVVFHRDHFTGEPPSGRGHVRVTGGPTRPDSPRLHRSSAESREES